MTQDKLTPTEKNTMRDELTRYTEQNMPYSLRELDDHFTQVQRRFDVQDTTLGNLNTKIDAVDKKVGIQNGRTAKLESWRTGLVMSGAVLIFLIGIIMTLIVYSFQLSQENLKNTILLEIKK